MSKKLKLQVSSKAKASGAPKWIAPEKRMRCYPSDLKDTTKIPFVKFRIVVPTEDDKKQLLAAFEYIHDNPIIDTNFIAVNQIAHAYVTPELEKGHPDMIVVNPDLYSEMQRGLK